GLDRMGLDDNFICVLLIFSAILAFFTTENFMLVFFSVLIISSGFIYLIFNGNVSNLIHIYNAAVTFSLTTLYLNEANFIGKKSSISNKYSAIRMGLIFSFLMGMIAVGIRDITPIFYNYVWVSSIFIIICVVVVILRTLKIFNIQQTNHKAIVLGSVVIILLPSVFSPAISGAILLVLLNYKVSYKAGVVIGLLAFVYF